MRQSWVFEQLDDKDFLNLDREQTNPKQNQSGSKNKNMMYYRQSVNLSRLSRLNTGNKSGKCKCDTCLSNTQCIKRFKEIEVQLLETQSQKNQINKKLIDSVYNIKFLSRQSFKLCKKIIQLQKVLQNKKASQQKENLKNKQQIILIEKNFKQKLQLSKKQYEQKIMIIQQLNKKKQEELTQQLSKLRIYEKQKQLQALQKSKDEANFQLHQRIKQMQTKNAQYQIKMTQYIDKQQQLNRKLSILQQQIIKKNSLIQQLHKKLAEAEQIINSKTTQKEFLNIEKEQLQMQKLIRSPKSSEKDCWNDIMMNKSSSDKKTQLTSTIFQEDNEISENIQENQLNKKRIQERNKLKLNYIRQYRRAMKLQNDTYEDYKLKKQIQNDLLQFILREIDQKNSQKEQKIQKVIQRYLINYVLQVSKNINDTRTQIKTGQKQKQQNKKNQQKDVSNQKQRLQIIKNQLHKQQKRIVKQIKGFKIIPESTAQGINQAEKNSSNSSQPIQKTPDSNQSGYGFNMNLLGCLFKK